LHYSPFARYSRRRPNRLRSRPAKMPTPAQRSSFPKPLSPASALAVGAVHRLLWAAGALAVLWLTVWWALA